MRRLIDIESLKLSIQIAIDEKLSLYEYLQLVKEVSKDANKCYTIVMCKDCKYYKFAKQGYCRFWKSDNHLPIDYCSRGDDSSIWN